jgi:hypothetical protein
MAPVHQLDYTHCARNFNGADLLNFPFKGQVKFIKYEDMPMAYKRAETLGKISESLRSTVLA